MNRLQRHIHDNKSGLDYVLTDNYYLPALKFPEETRPLGRWGRLHIEYRKTHRQVPLSVVATVRKAVYHPG